MAKLWLKQSKYNYMVGACLPNKNKQLINVVRFCLGPVMVNMKCSVE